MTLQAHVGAGAFVDPTGMTEEAAAHGAKFMGDLVSQNPHEALDVAGLSPGLGVVPDLLNAAWYAVEGDWGNSLLSMGAAIPVLGYGATAGKYGVKGVKAANRALTVKEARADLARPIGKKRVSAPTPSG